MPAGATTVTSLPTFHRARTQTGDRRRRAPQARTAPRAHRRQKTAHACARGGSAKRNTLSRGHAGSRAAPANGGLGTVKTAPVILAHRASSRTARESHRLPASQQARPPWPPSQGTCERRRGVSNPPPRPAASPARRQQESTGGASASPHVVRGGTRPRCGVGGVGVFGSPPVFFFCRSTAAARHGWSRAARLSNSDHRRHGCHHGTPGHCQRHGCGRGSADCER